MRKIGIESGRYGERRREGRGWLTGRGEPVVATAVVVVMVGFDGVGIASRRFLSECAGGRECP